MPQPVPPFQWSSLTPEQITATKEQILQDTIALNAHLAQLPYEALSFASLIEPLMTPPNYKTNHLVCQCKFLQHCSPDPAIRQAAKDAGIAFAKSRIAQRMDKAVFERVRHYAHHSEEIKQLTPYQSHFVQSLLEDFERSGLGLSDADQAKLVQLLEKDAELCSEYIANTSKEVTRLQFKREELAGVSEKFIESHEKENGEVEITLKNPDVFPILTTCEASEPRKRLTHTMGTVYGNNLELCAEAIQLRQQIAQLLGYNHYADYITASRMTGRAQIVSDFLSGLQEKVQGSARIELQRLLRLKKKHVKQRGEKFDGELHTWDFAFYHNLLMKEEYGVDEEAIREYFPLHVVVRETLAIYQELLTLRFEEIAEFDSWHEDVRLFAVYDLSQPDEPLRGHFYLDLHPREAKYIHTATFHLLKKNGAQFPADCMMTNMPAPVGDEPALVTHDDVVTFFHEFGHIMHNLCTDGDANNTHLAKCPRDFIEAPSQMLENWCWSSEVLERLSSHYKTGEKLPEKVQEKMLAAKNVNVALSTLRQIFLSTLDMTIHTEPPANAEELQALVDRLRPEITLFANPEGSNYLRNFWHLMNQYAAAYYGYLWSEVISADMFHTRFDKEGLFNAKTGMDYRQDILAVGGVGSIMEHVTKFLGRLPQQESFLRSRGLVHGTPPPQ